MSKIHPDAVARTRLAKTRLDTNEQLLEEAGAKLQLMAARLPALAKSVETLELKAAKHPKKFGAALKTARDDYKRAADEVLKQQALVQQLALRHTTDVGELEKAKRAAFDAAKQERVGGAVWTDSMEDAASLSPAKQREIIGVEIGIDAAKAMAADVKSLQDAVRTLPAPEALSLLNQKLQGTDPGHQAALLDQLRPEMKTLATAAATMSVMSRTANEAGEKYLEAMHGISPEARKSMVSTFADAYGKTVDWREGVNTFGHTGLGAALRSSLGGGAKHFSTASELSAALLAANKPEAASGVRATVADRASELRSTFEKKEKVVLRLRGELALLNQGVGGLMTDAQRAKAIDAFKAQHAKEFGAFDKAAADYSEVLDAMRGPTASPDDGGRTTYQNNKQYDAEMAALVKHLPSIQSTPEGEKQILKALSEQATGVGPAWLGELSKLVGTTKGLTEGTANVIAMGIAQLAARGSLATQHGVTQLLEKNAGVLGISSKSLGALDEAFSALDGTPESVANVQKALKEVEGGSFGSKGVNTGLRLIGLAVAAHGLANARAQWSDAELSAKMKTVVDGLTFGAEGAKLALDLLGRESASKTLSRYAGGLAVAGGILDGIASIKEFRDGNIGAGIANGLTSAGGLLMGAAAISGSFPGGQLAGAALAVAGLVANVIVGRRELAKAERAAEKDAFEYLKGGGVAEPQAKVLSNLRQSDHRNAGVPIAQVAEALKMNPNQLFERLQKLPPETLREYVYVMLSLEHTSNGKAVEGPLPDKHDGTDVRFDAPYVKTEQFFDGSVADDDLHSHEWAPRSISTASEWTKTVLAQNGV